MTKIVFGKKRISRIKFWIKKHRKTIIAEFFHLFDWCERMAIRGNVCSNHQIKNRFLFCIRKCVLSVILIRNDFFPFIYYLKVCMDHQTCKYAKNAQTRRRGKKHVNRKHEILTKHVPFIIYLNFKSEKLISQLKITFHKQCILYVLSFS